MNCLKHGFDWPHDKTCPYCDVDYLTVMNTAMESVLSLIGKYLKVDPGNVVRLFDAIGSLTTEVTRLRSELGATPCKRLMLQEQPYSECFPFNDCDGCDCWRSTCVPVSQGSVWSKEPPTEPGYYWWRQGDRIEPAEVCPLLGALAVTFVGEREPIEQVAWQPDWRWAPLAAPDIADSSHRQCANFHKCECVAIEGSEYCYVCDQEAKDVVALTDDSREPPTCEHCDQPAVLPPPVGKFRCKESWASFEAFYNHEEYTGQRCAGQITIKGKQ